jgi:hypothetical protein
MRVSRVFQLNSCYLDEEILQPQQSTTRRKIEQKSTFAFIVHLLQFKLMNTTGKCLQIDVHNN